MTTADEPAHPHDTDAVRHWLAEQLARAPEPTDAMTAIIVHVLAGMATHDLREDNPLGPPREFERHLLAGHLHGKLIEFPFLRRLLLHQRGRGLFRAFPRPALQKGAHREPHVSLQRHTVDRRRPLTVLPSTPTRHSQRRVVVANP
ncbi:hypothetical protein BCD48_09570 [Pseudofrankia sp. BMG5.36]|nr:hypothetical protein BCD48_09570 [Pseudofrankia sp. BMG5.36]